MTKKPVSLEYINIGVVVLMVIATIALTISIARVRQDPFTGTDFRRWEQSFFEANPQLNRPPVEIGVSVQELQSRLSTLEQSIIDKDVSGQ